MLEVKKDSYDAQEIDVEKVIYPILKSYRGDFVVKSFDPYTVKWFADNAPEFSRGLLCEYEQMSEYPPSDRALVRELLDPDKPLVDFFDYHVGKVGSEIWNEATKHLPAVVWTVRSQEQYEAVRSKVINVIFENFIPGEKGMNEKILTVAVIGYGSRGNVYTNYMKELGTMRTVCVCEPNEKKRELAAQRLSLGEEALFADENEFFAERRADVLLVATPDRAHYRHAVKGLELGYDLLLEKPISPDENECREICMLAEKKKRKVSVCHVLRYAPFYRKIKEIIASGELGEPVTISQTENVGYWHQAHSFVRGNWRNSKESSCMILQKCCHDLDIIKWLMDVPCRTVSSFGSLMYFNKAHAPAGSADFCYKCKLEKECPYDAIGFYMDKPDWLSSTGRFFGNSANAE